MVVYSMIFILTILYCLVIS